MGADCRRRSAEARLRAGREVDEVQRAEVLEEQEHPEDEAEVADAVDDERLLAGVGGASSS